MFSTSEGKEEYDVTGRATYLQACRDSGVIPVSFFHRNLQQADIDIKHHGLGPMGAKAIAVALVVGILCLIPRGGGLSVTRVIVIPMITSVTFIWESPTQGLINGYSVKTKILI